MIDGFRAFDLGDELVAAPGDGGDKAGITVIVAENLPKPRYDLVEIVLLDDSVRPCLLYTSDAADEVVPV